MSLQAIPADIMSPKPRRKNSKAKNGKGGPKPLLPTPKLYVRPRTSKKPTLYSDEIMDEILRRVAHGETLTQACNTNPGFPAPSTVIDWIHQDRHNLAERYARARDSQIARWADDIIDTSAKATPETANALRLVVDSKKWLIARLRPAQYGDKVDVTSAGRPLISASDLDIAKALAHALTPALPAPEPIEVEAVEVKPGGDA